MIAYNTNYTPPAPVLLVGVSIVNKPNQSLSIPALLDTAADISVLPDTLVDELELAPIAETMVEGFEGKQVPMAVYVVAFHIAGARLYPARVVIHPAEYALIGRNVLNSLFIRLDGPDLLFEVMAQR